MNVIIFTFSDLGKALYNEECCSSMKIHFHTSVNESVG